MENNTDSKPTYPPPPPFYQLFDSEGEYEAPLPPPPPEGGTFQSFGRFFDVNETENKKKDNIIFFFTNKKIVAR